MQFDKKLFSEKVAKHIDYQRISLRTAATKAKVSASTLSRIVNGNPPDIESYAKLCKWMMITSDYFIKK